MDFEGILRFWTADGGCEEKVTRDMTVHSHCRSLSYKGGGVLSATC